MKMLIDDIRICQFREETLVEIEDRIVGKYAEKWSRDRNDYFNEHVLSLSMKEFRKLYAPVYPKHEDKREFFCVQKSMCNSGSV